MVEKKEKTSVGRADLLKILHHNEKNLAAMAEFAGYKYVKKQEKPPEKLPEPKGTKGTSSDTTEDVQPVFDNKEKSKFWYAAKYRKKEKKEVIDQKPDWTEGDALTDEEVCINCEIKPPSTPPLALWSRLWPFLRSALGKSGDNGPIDIAKIIESTAKLKPISKLPKKQKRTWASKSNIILDFDERLVPFWDDTVAAYHGIKKLRGLSGLKVYTIDQGPHGPFRDLERPLAPPKRFSLPEPGTPLFIISDLGCFESSGWVTKKWIDFGKQLRNAGVTAVVLTPCPPRLWHEKLLFYYRPFWWDRASKLPQNLSAVTKTHSITIDEQNRRVERLLAFLSPAIRVEPALLRSVRLLAASQADSGIEGLGWNHRHLERCPLAFTYQEQFVEKYRHAFSEQYATVAKQIISLIDKYHSYLSPVVHYEEKIISGTLTGEPDRQAEIFMQKYYRTINANRPEMIAWFHRFTSRQHPQVWQKNKTLTACWVKINYRDWKEGKIQLRPGMRIHDVAWIFQNKHLTKYNLLQIGDSLIFNESLQHSDKFSIGSPLTTLTTESSWLQVFHDKENVHNDYALHLTPGQPTPISDSLSGRFILNSEQEEITIESMKRPSWAKDIGRDQKGLFLWLDQERERKIKWFAPGKYTSKNNREIIVDTGFWGDAIGIDQYGLYVDFAVNGVDQRMRWIESGKFLMSSPETKPKRRKNELLHEVILTQGFWLGETACTQELWEAVMGANPSHFKGKQRPVENISWNDCKQFIQKLNAIADLGFRFPTEAEWEYACRAGTQTPFSFGDSITPEQVNYRSKATVDVRSLPCNDWGLYEMHGNVWEWCSDWLGNYQADSVIDPLGPEGGVYRVLRGGLWPPDAGYVRSAYRGGDGPDNRGAYSGFRLARGHKDRFQRS